MKKRKSLLVLFALSFSIYFIGCASEIKENPLLGQWKVVKDQDTKTTEWRRLSPPFDSIIIKSNEICEIMRNADKPEKCSWKATDDLLEIFTRNPTNWGKKDPSYKFKFKLRGEKAYLVSEFTDISTGTRMLYRRERDETIQPVPNIVLFHGSFKDLKPPEVISATDAVSWVLVENVNDQDRERRGGFLYRVQDFKEKYAPVDVRRYEYAQENLLIDHRFNDIVVIASRFSSEEDALKALELIRSEWSADEAESKKAVDEYHRAVREYAKGSDISLPFVYGGFESKPRTVDKTEVGKRISINRFVYAPEGKSMPIDRKSAWTNGTLLLFVFNSEPMRAENVKLFEEKLSYF